MESRNPVLSRSGVWSPNGTQQTNYPPYANQAPGAAPYAGQGSPYAVPGQQQFDQYGQPIPQAAPQPPAKGVMTLDDVVLKTGILFAILAASAAATWLITPVELLAPVMIVSMIAGFITVLMVTLRRRVSPPLTFVYAVVEGIFIGAISKLFEYLYTGIVGQAILATFVAAGVTLAAYKFFKIRVTPMFQKVVTIATIAFAVMVLVNLVLAFAGINTGMRSIGSGAGLLAIGISAVAIVLAVLNLLLDFDHIQRGIEMGAPAEQSWVAAFGLMVTMVWLYIELLRVLSYFRN